MLLPYVKFPSGGASPFVQFPQIPKAPPGSKGGVIRHKSPGLIDLGAYSDEPVSKWDRTGKGNSAKTASASDSGLPAEWFPKETRKRVEHH
jgi:hypothetical protein